MLAGLCLIVEQHLYWKSQKSRFRMKGPNDILKHRARRSTTMGDHSPAHGVKAGFSCPPPPATPSDSTVSPPFGPAGWSNVPPQTPRGKVPGSVPGCVIWPFPHPGTRFLGDQGTKGNWARRQGQHRFRMVLKQLQSSEPVPSF